MSYSFVANSVTVQTPDETKDILHYELIMLIVALEQPHGEEFGYTEFADVTAMLRMYAEQKVWVFDDFFPNQLSSLYNVHDSKNKELHDIPIVFGKFVQANHYYKRFGEFSQKGHPTEHFAELIKHLLVLCKCMDWDFWEACSLGEKRYAERMRDLVNNGIKDQLKTEFR